MPNKNKYNLLKTLVIVIITVALIAPSVFSAPPSRQLTEIVTNDYGTDNLATFIRNSNGNYWEATGANIQTAIDDVAGTNGTVWLASGVDYTTTAMINVTYNCTLDLGYSTIKPSGDFHAFKVYDQSVLQNGVIDISDSGYSNTTAAVKIIEQEWDAGWPQNDTPNWVNTFGVAKAETVRDISIIGDNTIQTGIGISLRTETPGNMFGDGTYSNIKCSYLHKGIALELQHDNTYINANHFSDLTFIDCYHSIYLNQSAAYTAPSGEEIAMNTFDNIWIEADQYSIEMEQIYLIGNRVDYNIFSNFGIMDFTAQGDADHYINITEGDGNWFSGSTLHINYIYDSGSNNGFYGTQHSKVDELNTNYLNRYETDDVGIRFYANPATGSNPVTYFYGDYGGADQYGYLSQHSSGEFRMASYDGQDIRLWPAQGADTNAVIIDDILNMAGRSTDPPSVAEGTIWYNTTSNKFQFREGTSTTDISGGAADGYYDVTKIWNSNGNSWTATGANIQLALNDVGNDSGWVDLGSMSYTISSHLKIWDNTDFIGNRATITLADAANDEMINMGYVSSGAGANDGIHNVLIEGITFDANNDSQTWNQYHHTISICSDSSNITIRDCTFLNSSTDTIWVYRLSGNTIAPTNIIIEDNRFLGMHKYIGDYPGAVYMGGQHSIIRNNYAEDMWACGFILEDWNYQDSSNNIVDGNTIVGEVSVGIWCEGGKSHNNTIINNIIDNINSSAYSAQSYYSRGMTISDYNIVSNNKINNTVEFAIQVSGDHNTFSANKIHNVIGGGLQGSSGDAVQLAGVLENNRFIGNDFIDFARYGCTADSNNEFINNHFEGGIRGLSISSVNNVTSNGNKFVGQSGDGIMMYNAVGCTIVNNRVNTNGDGIQSTGTSSNRNIITNNDLTGSTTPANIDITTANADSIIKDNIGHNYNTWLILPTTATLIESFLRYDDTNNQLEVYDSGSWVEFNAGAGSDGYAYDDKIHCTDGTSWEATGPNLVTAINAKNNSGEKIIIPPGTYYLDGDIQYKRLVVEGSGVGGYQGDWGYTKIVLDGTEGITIGNGGILKNLKVYCNDSWTGDTAVHYVANDGWASGSWGHTNLIENVEITNHNSWRFDGTALNISAINHAIALASFSHIHIGGFEYGLVLYANDNGGTGYINGNNFYDLRITNGIRGITIHGTNGGEVSCNKFFGVEFDPDTANTQVGLDIIHGDHNYFYGAVFWDWGSMSASMVNMSADTKLNVVEMVFGDTDNVNDLGLCNMVQYNAGASYLHHGTEYIMGRFDNFDDAGYQEYYVIEPGNNTLYYEHSNPTAIIEQTENIENVTIRVKPDTYEINDWFLALSDLTVTGSGKHNTIFQAEADVGGSVYALMALSSSGNNGYFKDMTFDAAQHRQYVIHTSTNVISNWTFENCVFKGANETRLAFLRSASNWKFINCDFYGKEVYVYESEHIIFEKCNFYDAVVDAMYIRNSNNITVINCYFENYADDGIYLQNSEDTIIKENIFDSPSGDESIVYSATQPVTPINIIKDNIGYNENHWLILPTLAENLIESFLRYDDTNNQLEVYDDGSWVEFNAGAGSDGYIFDEKIHTSEGDSYSATDTNIQAAVDSLTSGGTVYLPSGTISMDIQIDLDNDIRIQGAGIGNTILSGVAGMSTAEDFFRSVQNDNVTLCDFTIEANGYGEHGLFLAGSNNVIIENIVINDPYYHGIYVAQRDTGSVNSTNVFINNVQVHGMSGHSDTHALAISQSKSVTVSNFQCSGNTKNWPVDITRSENISLSNILIGDSLYGIKIVGTANEKSKHISIDGLTATSKDHTQWGFRSEYCENSNFNNINIKGYKVGMYLYGTAMYNNYNNINIDNCGATSSDAGMFIRALYCNFNNIVVTNGVSTSDGITINSAHDNIFSNVRIDSSGSDGMYLTDSYNLTFNGGSINDCTLNAIRGDNSHHFKVIGFDLMNVGYEGFDSDYEDPCHNYTFESCSFSNNNLVTSSVGGIDQDVADEYVIISNCIFDSSATNDFNSDTIIMRNNLGYNYDSLQDGYIWNSNGNYWEATGENIQLAVNDLNSTNGGTVWIPAGTFEFDVPLKTYNRTIILEGTGLGSHTGGIPTEEPCTMLQVSWAFADGYLIDVGEDDEMTTGTTIRNMVLNGRLQTDAYGAIRFLNVHHGKIENVMINRFYGTPFEYGYGINITSTIGYGSYYNVLERIFTRQCSIGVNFGYIANGNTFLSGQLTGRGTTESYGTVFDGSDTNNIYNVDHEWFNHSGSGAAWFLDESDMNKFIGTRFEYNRDSIVINSGGGTGDNMFLFCTFQNTAAGGTAITDNGNQKSHFIGMKNGTVEYNSIDRRIRNSNGNYWEATGANLQSAVNDLNNESGWVYIPSMIDIGDTIKIGNGCTLYSIGRVGGLRLTNGANCSIIENYDQINGNHNITIRGLTLDGNGANQDAYYTGQTENSKNGIEIFAPSDKMNRDILIEDCTIKNSECAGIVLEYGEHIKILNVDIKDAGISFEGGDLDQSYASGVFLLSVFGATISDVFVDGAYACGITVETVYQDSSEDDIDTEYYNYSTDWTIENCITTNCQSGIYCENIKDGVIINCQSYDNRKIEAYPSAATTSGIRLVNSLNSSVIGCIVNRNGASDTSAGIAVNGYNNLIDSCQVSNTTGYGIYTVKNGNRVTNNVVLDSGATGIESTGIDSSVIGNSVNASGTAGIRFLADGYTPVTENSYTICSNNVIDGTATSDGHGIALSVPNAVISGNTIVDTSKTGVYLLTATADNCLIQNNIMVDTGDECIRIAGAENVSVIGNNLDQGTTTVDDEVIEIDDSNNTIVSDNHIMNGVDGIQIDDSDNTMISGNRIMGCVRSIDTEGTCTYSMVFMNNCRGNTNGIDVTGTGSMSDHNLE